MNIVGQVKLSMVLCQSGRVTNIEVVQGLPYGLTEEAIKVARKIKFKPAEKDGQPASEQATITYVFNR